MRKPNLTEQLLFICIVIVVIMIISLGIILPRNLLPIYEDNLYNYLGESLNILDSPENSKINSEVAYIYVNNENIYISNNLNKVLGLDSPKKILSKINKEEGKFLYNKKVYYYSTITSNNTKKIALTGSSYINDMRISIFKIILLVVGITFIIVSMVILIWSNSLVNRIKKLKENGYLTMLCSGRTQRFLEMDIDKFMGAITCNGSHTEVEGEVIRDICIPDELVFQVVNEYFPRDTIIHFETRDISYYLHMDEEFFKNHCKLFNLPQRWYAPWKFRTKNTHISKLVMNYKDIQVKKDFEEEFKDVFTCAKHVRENFIDITLKGVTKGDAITELIAKLGIDKKDTYAFGDADNDVEMMQAVGTGIAMGRHSEKVGEVASMVTGTVKEEGITMALKKLGLI